MGGQQDPSANLPVISSPADLGQLVRQMREGRRLSQQDFADLAGVGRRFLSELENGKTTLELGKVLKVLQAAGVDLFARKR
jgi:HTH-type transcriptional regulator/antitoxin HipB